MYRVVYPHVTHDRSQWGNVTKILINSCENKK